MVMFFGRLGFYFPQGRTIRKLMGGGGGGRAKYQKNIRARENEMKKKFVHAN